MLKWQNPLLTLGERCVAFSENELNNGVKESYPGSYTSDRIIEYFSICTRKINGKEVSLNLKKGNWCSAAVSFSLYNSILPGDIQPHGYRVGVVEIVSELRGLGRWHPKKDVLNQDYKINIGDSVVFDRSQFGKPKTSWWRHIGMVYDVTSKGFDCISGNSYGKYRVTSHKLSQNNLLGFGEYPNINSDSTGVPLTPMDWSNINIEDLAPMVDTGKNLEYDNIFSVYDRIFNR